MPNTNFKKYKCNSLKTELAKKQFAVTNSNIKGLKGLTLFKKLIDEIDDILDDIYHLKCHGADYVYQGPIKLEKKTFTKLQLNRATDPSKLFINSSEAYLPPKKRISVRKN